MTHFFIGLRSEKGCVGTSDAVAYWQLLVNVGKLQVAANPDFLLLAV